MTDIAFSPSISFISLLLQVRWSTRSCKIWSRSQTWLNSLLLISSILGSGCSLYSCSKTFFVSHTSTLGTTVDFRELVFPGVGDRMLLISLLSSSKPAMTSRRIWGTSSVFSSSLLSSEAASATPSSSPAVAHPERFPLYSNCALYVAQDPERYCAGDLCLLLRLGLYWSLASSWIQSEIQQ